MELLNDTKVRRLLLNELNLEYSNCENTRIINELGLDFGASRVDIAVVNGILHGYEIKSDLDNLNRLPRQIEYYSRAFERMTIVVSKSHLLEVKEMVPSWWGIKTISKDKSRLINVRKGRRVSYQDSELLLKLLWKKELDGFVDELNLPKSYKKYRQGQLLSIIEDVADLVTIRSYVYDILKKRTGWRLD